MASELLPQTDFQSQSRQVSALGLKLRALRDQIEAAAARGETMLLTREELDRELEDLRPGDPDVR
jgi:cell division protein FtsB